MQYSLMRSPLTLGLPTLNFNSSVNNSVATGGLVHSAWGQVWLQPAFVNGLLTLGAYKVGVK